MGTQTVKLQDYESGSTDGGISVGLGRYPEPIRSWDDISRIDRGYMLGMILVRPLSGRG